MVKPIIKKEKSMVLINVELIPGSTKIVGTKPLKNDSGGRKFFRKNVRKNSSIKEKTR